MCQYLDPQIISEFRNLINSSNIFYKSNEQKPRWNLICVLMDRLDSAISFLNSHSNQPETEEEFISVMVFASIVKDGIYKFFTNIYGKKPPTIELKKWFSCASVYEKPYFNDETCPTDDVFFEYLRAVTFAHPFETTKGNRSNRAFMKEGAVHMSPWVFSNVFFHDKKMVGVRIYTNDIEEPDTLDVLIPFENLKSYIRERYELINEFISWGKKAIDIQNKNWKSKKIERIGTPKNILLNVREILKERFVEEYLIDEAISVLNYSSNVEKNNNAAKIIKKIIEQKIDIICDTVDIFDYEKLNEELDILYKRPKNLHPTSNYELEKIFSYLHGSRGVIEVGSNEEWGIKQARSFVEKYAYKYVFVDVDKMDYSEIRILVRIACILGWLEEREIYNEKK